MSPSPYLASRRALPHRWIRRMLGLLGLAAIVLTALGLAVAAVGMSLSLLPLVWGWLG